MSLCNTRSFAKEKVMNQKSIFGIRQIFANKNARWTEVGLAVGVNVEEWRTHPPLERVSGGQCSGSGCGGRRFRIQYLWLMLVAAAGGGNFPFPPPASARWTMRLPWLTRATDSWLSIFIVSCSRAVPSRRAAPLGYRRRFSFFLQEYRTNSLILQIKINKMFWKIHLFRFERYS